MGIIYNLSEDQVFEEARTTIKAQMDLLEAAMSADNPKPEEVYNTHAVLKADLPCISVGVESAYQENEPAPQNYGAGATIPVDNRVTVSIRVHTNWNYEGAWLDEVKCWRLLNSIKNWLYVHRQPGNDFYVMAIGESKIRESFAESLTIGGSIMLELYKSTEITLA